MASVGAIGTMLIVFILSIYMVIDRDAIMAFLFRLVPPSYAEEARLLQTSVARSFGGFLRGQALMGIVYFAVALATNLLLGLPLAALTSTASGVLMAIPFFGPFLAWAPPVIVALVFKPDALLPAPVIMGIGWLVVMNVLQPRIMQGAVGIHPIVVLGSVLIGSQDRRHPGGDLRDPDRGRRLRVLLPLPASDVGRPHVTGRAAKRLSEREGRPVRVPREPGPGRRPTSRSRERRRAPADDGNRARTAEAAARRGPGHDPRARPLGAARRRQGARRAAGRRRGPWRARGRCARRAARSPSTRAGRASSSPTTTASSRAACWRSSRRSSRWAT